ncbi:2-hydroxyacid dehydrogenase [Larsenimonas salina]|uniref:2-hydroxyacid dehydrogenase n=1 Tax=Larsenimonas salina TaxID=1295565 RepID=UPI00207425E5|nr:D-glycerate dehydrogenase [Larsenimonas salina]MCM5704235.1 D-glycerate dehydrogenase [Larsenimonas salina]
MKPNVVIVHELYPELLKTLEQHYNVVHFTRLNSDADRADFNAAMAEADAFLGSNVKFDEALIERSPRLKVIASVSVGVDAYPREALKARGIVLTNTPEVLTDATADTGFVLLMMAARRAGEMERKVRSGNWSTSLMSQDFGVDVTGKTLGIVGMGRIGQAVAKRGHFGFDMPVIFQNRSSKPEVEAALDARQVDLDTLFETADFIVVTAALSDETRGMIGRAQLERTREKTILINISRGPVVREQELIECLQEGVLYYAGLDVYEREPLDPSSPLMGLDNVVLLPHIGSSTVETRGAMCDLAADNLNRVLAGTSPLTPA